MHSSSVPPNPEFEMWRLILLRRRKAERRQGWILILIGGGDLLFLLAPPLIDLEAMLRLGLFFLLVDGLIMLCFASALGLGISMLAKTLNTPTEQEIARARQIQRAQLFRWAQGELPWSYRPVGQRWIALWGVLLLVLSLVVLAAFGLQAWQGWIGMLMGMVLLVLALVLLPQERRRLVVESAARLAQGLVAGEITEGLPLQDESPQP